MNFKTNKLLIAIPHQQHSYHTYDAIQKEFDSFYMTSVYFKNDLLDRTICFFLPKKFKKIYMKKKMVGVDERKVFKKNRVRGLFFLFGSRLLSQKSYLRVVKNLERRFARSAEKFIYKNKIEMVIMYDNAASSLFSRQIPSIKVLDMSSIPAQTIRNIILKEKETDDYLKESLSTKLEYANAFIESSKKEIQNADYFFCPSNFVETALLELGIEKKRIYRIPYGVDTSYFCYKKRVEPKNKIKFVFVGRLEAAKGVYYLIEAFKQFSFAELHVAGAVLIDQSYIPDNVYCHGFLDKSQLRELLYESDIMIMTSLWEGLSLSILEGMSTGLPVICNSSTGYTGIIKNFVNGIMIDNLDVKNVEQAIKWFFDNKKMILKLGMNASNTAKEYTWENYNSKVCDAIKDIFTKVGR